MDDYFTKGIVVALIATLALIGVIVLVAVNQPDRGRCLESHSQTMFMPMRVGNVTIMRPDTRRVCDRWEFPEGRETEEGE